MRIIADSNVLLSATISEGPPFEIVNMVLNGTLVIVFSRETWGELGDVLMTRTPFDRIAKEVRGAYLGHIAERATIDGAAFAMRIIEVRDTVKLTNSGGQTWIGHASADLDLSSGHGGFDIDRADGSVTAKTGDGAIRIGRLTRGQAELLNGSGNIEVGISEGTAARVDANSERGSVRNSVPSQEIPDTSDNTVTVHARTRYGDIIIQRAAN